MESLHRGKSVGSISPTLKWDYYGKERYYKYRFSSGGTNAQKKVTEVAKKHGLLKKDGGQNMSKVKL